MLRVVGGKLIDLLKAGPKLSTLQDRQDTTGTLTGERGQRD